MLTALSPSAVTDIKGKMRTYDELKAASGYENKRREFDELVQILDRRSRLISPVDTDPHAQAKVTLYWELEFKNLMNLSSHGT